MKHVIIIGAGAAGIMAALAAAGQGASVTLLEKNNIVGKKMGITGKGRCNLTNACAMDEFVAHTPGNGKFLYSAYGQFSNDNLLDLLHQWGLETKVERGGRVFPQSDSAIEVRKLLYDRLCRAGVHIRLNEAATAVQRWGDTFAVRTQAQPSPPRSGGYARRRLCSAGAIPLRSARRLGSMKAKPVSLRRAACPIPLRARAATDTALPRAWATP